MNYHNISTINKLTNSEKSEIYTRLLPQEILTLYSIPATFINPDGEYLLFLNAKPGTTQVEMKLFHQSDFEDPILYGHMTDTINGMIHVLLYILNDPDSPRFDVDKMPDGTPTVFGTKIRNIEAELSAFDFGLNPGQIRRGPNLFKEASIKFEHFIESLGQTLYFTEPLYYHNAVILEKYGFGYQMGKKSMESIHAEFQPGGNLHSKLDNSSPFRLKNTHNSIRARSWAIHDGILGSQFTGVTMYTYIGKMVGISTCLGCDW